MAKRFSAATRVRRTRVRYLPGLLSLVLIVIILYAGKPVLMPLALSVLIAFVLTPLVVQVQRYGLSRVPAVLTVVGFTLILAGCVAWGVGVQIIRLADDLPAHETQIREKIVRLRGSGAGPASRLIAMFHELTQTITEPNVPTSTAAPPPVVTAVPRSSSLDELSGLAVAVIEPVADAVLVLILVIFLLIRREDLRNRIVGLLGHGRLTGTTRVLVGSAERLSRYLFLLLCVNTCFGLAFGLALLMIGVPYSFLWGFLIAVMRFVPYVGSWLAASLPVLLSFAIFPGWSRPLLSLGAFLVLDTTTANAIEPLLFGHSTGVSPPALLVAAVFWTWIWGPIGLALSTPLTVCLVVLGQHVPRLRFLSLLLGDQPALSPAVNYYQRLLAGDRREARALAIDYGKEHGLERLADDVLVPALHLARRDRRRSGLTAEDETFIIDSTGEVSAEFSSVPDRSIHARGVILGCPAHHRAEELIVSLTAAAIEPLGWELEAVTTRMLPVEIETRIRERSPRLVFVAVLPPGGVTQARYLCRRLRKRFPDLKIVVGHFGRVRDFDRLLSRLRASGASYVATSVTQSRSQILAVLESPRIAPAAAN